MKRIRRLVSDRRGVSAIIMALLLPVIAGSLAMVSDLAYWRYRAMVVQKAADAAAIAVQFNINSNVPALKASRALSAAAQSSATQNGWSSFGGGSVTAYYPPKSGIFAGNSNYAQVIVVEKAPRLFSGIWGSGSQALTGQAVAAARSGPSGSGCILSLNKTSSGAVTLLNNVQIQNPDCDVVANSTSASAVSLSNNASIAGFVTTPGNVHLSNNASVGGVMAGVMAQPDPYASLISLPQTGAGPCKDPMSGGVPQPVNWSGKQTISLTPGHWCKGWNASNGITLNLSPGVYYVDSQFNFQNNCALNGTGGVTIVFGPGYVPNWGNNAVFNLVAPTSGPTSGLVLTQYTSDTASGTYNFANNLRVNYTGDIYLPTKNIQVQNNGYLDPINAQSGCGRIISYDITLYNNTVIGNNCAGDGVQPFGSRAAKWSPNASGPQKSGVGIVQ